MTEAETIRLDTNLVVFDAQVINRRTGEFVNGLRGRRLYPSATMER
jgi:hypothetical protein